MEKSEPIMTENDVNYIRAIYVAVDMLKLGIVDECDFWEYERRIARKYKIANGSIYRINEIVLLNILKNMKI